MSYNTSDNNFEVQAKLSPSHNSYTVSGVPGVTYYITVFAVNALGPGPISEYTTVNGELNTLSYDFHELIIQFHCFLLLLQHNSQLIHYYIILILL